MRLHAGEEQLLLALDDRERALVTSSTAPQRPSLLTVLNGAT